MVMAGLAGLCAVLPGQITWGDKTLRWPTFAEVFETSSLPLLQDKDGENEVDYDLTDEIIVLDTTAIEDTIPSSPKIVVPKVKVDSTTDSRMFLSSFYEALEETGERVVRVVHYGDSQIEEDRMTQQIRELMQRKYGGAGVGLLPLAQTIPSRAVRQELRMNERRVSPANGPKRYLVYGIKSAQREDGMYGVMGQRAEMNDSLVSGSEIITAICKPLYNGPRYSRMRVLADDDIRYEINGDTVHLTGRGGVYGISQESDTGVIVDNIPMRGCLGLVFTKIDSMQLSTFYREENVRLIILQFGGNAIPYNEKPGTIRGIVNSLRKQVQYIQSCAPNASILFIGPSDMARQTEGEWETYPMVPYMDRMLRKMALEENIAYFSLYRWMGGSGSMVRWQENGLAGGDGVHFFRSGARRAGNAVAEWILAAKPKKDKTVKVSADSTGIMLNDTTQLPNAVQETHKEE